MSLRCLSSCDLRTVATSCVPERVRACAGALSVLCPYLPSHSEMTPTQKEESMPPMEKMATDRDQSEVSVPRGMGSPYRWCHVAL